MWAVFMGNRVRWGKHEGLAKWLTHCRLDVFTTMVQGENESDTEKQLLLQRHREKIGPAVQQLPKLLAEIE